MASWPTNVSRPRIHNCVVTAPPSRLVCTIPRIAEGRRAGREPGARLIKCSSGSWTWHSNVASGGDQYEKPARGLGFAESNNTGMTLMYAATYRSWFAHLGDEHSVQRVYVSVVWLGSHVNVLHDSSIDLLPTLTCHPVEALYALPTTVSPPFLPSNVGTVTWRATTLVSRGSISVRVGQHMP